jgi:DNA-binding transcriptional MocR family regulator
MLQAIKRHLPSDVHVIPPKGGLFIWLQLPDSLSAETLLPLACEEGVAFTPGNRFFPDASDGDRYLRLNFAMHPPTEIEEGIQRLGLAWKRLHPNDTLSI